MIRIKCSNGLCGCVAEGRRRLAAGVGRLIRMNEDASNLERELWAGFSLKFDKYGFISYLIIFGKGKICCVTYQHHSYFTNKNK